MNRKIHNTAQGSVTPPGLPQDPVWGFPEIEGAFWGPYNTDPSIVGSTLGSFY